MLSSRIARRCLALGLVALVACSDDPNEGASTAVDAGGTDVGGTDAGGTDVGEDAGGTAGCAAAAECGHVLRGSAIGRGEVVDVAVADEAWVLGPGGLEVYTLDGGERIGEWAVADHRFATALAVDGDRALVMSSTYEGSEGGDVDPPFNPDPEWAALTGHVLDVSDPEAPALVTEFAVMGAIPDAWLPGLELIGDTALIQITGEEGAPSAIFDLSQDPPVEIGRLGHVDNESDVVDVALVDRDTVLVVGYEFESMWDDTVLRSYRISAEGLVEIQTLVLESESADRNWPQVAWTSDRVVVVSSATNSSTGTTEVTVRTFTLDGFEPIGTATWDGDQFVGGLFTAGGIAFLKRQEVLAAFDVSAETPVEVEIPDALAPVLASRTTTGGDRLTAVVDDALQIVDVADLSESVDVEQTPLTRRATGDVTGVAWVGDVLVAADGPELRVHDACGVNGGDGVVLASDLVEPRLVSGGSRLAVESDGVWQMYDFASATTPAPVAVDITEAAAVIAHEAGLYAVVERALVVVDETGAVREQFELDPDPDAEALNMVAAMAHAGDRLVVFPGPRLDSDDPQGSSVHLFDVSDPLAPMLVTSHRFATSYILTAWLVGDTLHANGRVGTLGELDTFEDWPEDERTGELQQRQVYGDRWIGTRYSPDGAVQQLVTWRGDEPEVVVAELTDNSQRGRVTALGFAGGLVALGRGVTGFDLVGISCAAGD